MYYKFEFREENSFDRAPFGTAFRGLIVTIDRRHRDSTSRDHCDCWRVNGIRVRTAEP